LADIEAKLDYIESSLRLSNKAFQISQLLLTAQERGLSVYTALGKVEGIVKDLNDEYLLNLYTEALRNPRVPSPRVEFNSFFAFLMRLSTLVYESAAKANEADIDLREAVGLPAETGIWGKRGWHPPAM
jgi:hypothetical protein